MAEEKFKRFLLSLDRFQQRLAEFMLGRYLEFDFSATPMTTRRHSSRRSSSTS
ncbi:hypothetical protein ACKI1I_00255 [Streptomyces turgidiscabies]|uniref:hypothetical protein n=1 Tax=Streptomyces TaxID=1883 RepID=UPI001319FD02|nr:MULTISPECIES: hypothetical protein [Streptomyces]MDX3492689.1 hypothetical protein [Streptomyces turgidiscabies]